jgi:hypothetical protein
VDFDENYDRAEGKTVSVLKMFERVLGCENITSKLEGYQQMVKTPKTSTWILFSQYLSTLCSVGL